MIECKDESGKTALMIACSENDSPDVAKMLIGYGAKILVHDHCGNTPILDAGMFVHRFFVWQDNFL
jgi:ankyrin repeat protein